MISYSSLSDEELYSWSIFLDTRSFIIFSCGVGCGFEDDVDFETGRFVIHVSNMDKLMLSFVDGGVTTTGLLCEIRV